MRRCESYHTNHMCDLVPFVQLKKRKKHPRGSASFSKVAG